MPKIEGSKEVQNTLSKLQSKSKREDNASVSVGYQGVAYALFVHEIKNPSTGVPRRGDGKKGNYWDVGQPKFLERPFRENAKEYARIIRTAYKRGVSLDKSLLIAGLKLQRDSQQLVPIDTGNLKGSAFTEKDK
ncbi:hypothetical protein OAG36_00630 [bacterium]|nr:hypothetical protein [bacterium]